MKFLSLLALFYAAFLGAEAALDVSAEMLPATLSKHPCCILDVYAKGCPPCRRLSPIFEQLAKKYEGICFFAKIDGSNSQTFCANYGIKGFPTLIYFKEGKEVGRQVGLLSVDQYIQQIDDQYRICGKPQISD